MIFISHKESDSILAKGLVEFLRASLDLSSDKIRCSSVPGFQLPFGKTISGQLKDDIGASNAVLVLLTRSSLQSRWVLFELGAAWALGKIIVPVLGPGLSQTDLPGPLAEYPVVKSDDNNTASRLRDAIAQIARGLSITEKVGGEPQSGLESFLKLLREWSPTDAPETARAVAFQLSWLLTLLLMKQAHHKTAVEAQVEAFSAELGLKLPQTWRKSLFLNKGEGFMNLIGELGGQLVVQKPQLAAYFEAGFNMIFCLSKSDYAGVVKSLSHLDLPKELREHSEDKVVWANQVHEYFENVLRERAG